MVVPGHVPMVLRQAGARVSSASFGYDPGHYLRAIPHADDVVHYRRGHFGHGPKLCDYMESWKPYAPRSPYRDVRGFPTCLWCMKHRMAL